MFSKRNLSPLPSLESVSEEYSKAILKRNALNAEVSKLRIEATELREDIRVGKDDSSAARVEAILTGDSVVAERPSERLSAVLQKLTDLDRALEVHERSLNAARARASVLVCDQIRDRNKELLAGICTKFSEIHELSVHLDGLFNELDQCGVATTSLPRVMTNLLSPRDRYSAIAYFLKDARELGIIERDAIPEAIRQ